MAFRTQAQVDKLKLPAGKTEAWEFDEECTGLSIRLQGARRTWVVWYPPVGTTGPRRPKMTLADVSSLPLREARTKAGRIRADAKDGKDPLTERAKAKAKAAETFGALVTTYLEQRAKPRQRPSTYAETYRYLTKRWAPLHDRALSTVTNRDVDARLHEISRDHGPGAATKARVYLSGMFSWAMRQPRLGVAHNPVVGTEAPHAETRNGRALSEGELVAIWRACEGLGEFGSVIRLLMLTGGRRDEVAGLRWSEIDLDKALWILPAARAKNGQAMLKRGQTEHEVPLGRQAVALIEAQDRRGEFVFGRGGRSGFSGYSRAKARLDQILGEAVAPWTIHDLRRSAVTHMAEIGIDPHVIEACINHLSGHRGGIAGVYNRATYRPQKTAAMQRWGDWLEALIEGRAESNVVALAG